MAREPQAKFYQFSLAQRRKLAKILNAISSRRRTLKLHAFGAENGVASP